MNASKLTDKDFMQAYTKNQDCRIASQKSGFTKSIEKICGKVPVFEDYQK